MYNPNYILVCPMCRTSINNGEFTKDVTYVVNLESSEEGRDYKHGDIETILEDTHPTPDDIYYCRSCNNHFTRFDKRPLVSFPNKKGGKL